MMPCRIKGKFPEFFALQTPQRLPRIGSKAALVTTELAAENQLLLPNQPRFTVVSPIA